MAEVTLNIEVRRTIWCYLMKLFVKMRFAKGLVAIKDKSVMIFRVNGKPVLKDITVKEVIERL